MSNERPDDAEPAGPTVSCSREELGIDADEVVFINASPAEMVSAETREVWARVLAAVPGSLLAVAPFAGRKPGDEALASFVEALEKVLVGQGVDDQRLIVFMRDLATRADVRKFLGLGTVYLDVHPQADRQGLSDALVACLPAVTWQGQESPSLAAASLLRDIRMDELVASSADELVSKARQLASDARYADAIRERIAAAVAAKPLLLDPKPGAMDTQGGTPDSGSRKLADVSVDAAADGQARTARTQQRCSRPSASAQSMAPIDDPFWRGKRVMVYTDLPGIYGVGQYNHALLCDLARRGAKAYCVQTKDGNPLVREREALGIEHVWLGYHTRREFERTFTDMKEPNRLFKKLQPDLIAFSNCSPRSNLAAKRVAMQRKIPFVIAESYVPAELIALPAWTKECDTLLSTQYRAARQVIAVSRENLDLLREQYGLASDKGVVIHYGRPAAYFAPRDEAARKRLRTELAIPEDAVLCLTAARLDPVKGYQYQLRALAALKGSDVWPKLYFAWAGAGPAEADIREGIQRLGVADHVRMLGERHDVLDWLSAADCFVLTSKAEGMPICIMEAMAKGLPVAATAVSGTPEELGNTGCLLPDPNKAAAEEVAGALVKVLDAWVRDEAGRQAEGSRCRARADGMFRVERMLEETRTVLGECLGVMSDNQS